MTHSSVTTTLPNKKDPVGFRNLVFDRQRAFMVMEVVRVREALMGSDALIAKAKADPSAYMLSQVITADKSSLRATFKHFFNIVSELGWGDASLRWSGRLAAVTPFAPNAPVRACFSKSCACDGKLKQTDIIAFIKSQHKPNWQGFLDYMESLRAASSEPDESASELRLRLQRTLDKLNNDYLKMMDAELNLRAFPHNDLIILGGERSFLQDVPYINPLSPANIRALSSGDPFVLSLDTLTVLRFEGRTMRDAVIHDHCKVGTDLYFEAEQGGRHANELYAEAESKWSMTLDLMSGLWNTTSALHLSMLALQQSK